MPSLIKVLRIRVDKSDGSSETYEGMKGRKTILDKETTGAALCLAGLNDNLEFMGRHLHVQTENAGFPVAHIVTQVFCKGKVVLSKKTDYPPGVREAGDIGTMQELMRAQHIHVIRSIAAKESRILGAHQASESS